MEHGKGKTRETVLRRWRVVEVSLADGKTSRHVYGHDAHKDTGCASSAIHAFDKEAMCVTTHSGSIYKLTGLPGHSHLGKLAWEGRCKGAKIVSERDVTDEYLNISDLSIAGFDRLNRTITD